MRNSTKTALTLLLTVAWILGSSGSQAELLRRVRDPDELRQRVRQAALATYFHGITEQIAKREVGSRGIPFLLELLQDPDFPRRDNVVGFLAYLGGADARSKLLDFLQAPPAGIDIPEEDRALLLTPQVLGHIARRVDRGALDALLAMTAPGSEGGPLATASTAGWYPDTMRDDLVEMALRGLALSGDPEGRKRLEQVAGDRAIPVLRGKDLRPQATSALELYNELWGGRIRPSGQTGPGRGPVGPRLSGSRTVDVGSGGPPVQALDVDTNGRSHESRLTYANHVDHPNPMTDSRLDQVLTTASYRAATADFTGDVACCIKVSRSGAARTFGTPGDGNDIIEMNNVGAVVGDPTARVKVVRAINYCGGPGINIIGCAFTPGNGMALVRVVTPPNSVGIEAVLWIHEYGHNTGLPHNPNSQDIMFASNNGANNGLTQTECNSYHSPPPATAMNPVDIGVCQDDDADDIVSSMDNCPDDFNPNQQDSDGDGIGDACESTTTVPALANISTRGLVQTGDNVLIGGFIVEGQGLKTVLIRALGPSLSGMGVTGELPDPTLQLLVGQTVIAQNDDWQSSPDAAQIIATQLAPPDSMESAIFATLGPGKYTAIVRGVNATTGVGLVEIYDVGGANTARLSNISTRGLVETGQNVLIGGFMIGGTDPVTVLVRALGPTLSSFQVAGALADPTLQLMMGQNLLDENDNWGSSPDSATIAATGLAPPDSLESAVLATLNPGAYTVIVSGVNNTTGVGLVEVYEIVPSPVLLPKAGDKKPLDRFLRWP